MSTEVKFDQGFFDTVLKSPGVERLTRQAAERALAKARATAPVDSGDYKKGLKVVRAPRRYRTAYLVEGTDRKTLLIESKTGNLARALKSIGGR